MNIKDKDINKMKNLVDISYMITHSMDFFQIKDEIVDKMLEVIHPTKACINLFYENDYTNAYLVCSKTLSSIPNRFKNKTDKGIKIKFEEYPDYIHESVRTEKIIHIENIFSDDRANKEIEIAKEEGYKGRIVFPLIVNYNIVGFMTCFMSEEQSISKEDEDFISSVSSLISLSIDVTMRNKSSEKIIGKLREALASINNATKRLYQNKDINEFLNLLSRQACLITRSEETIITIEPTKKIKKILSIYRNDKQNMSDIFPILDEIKANEGAGKYINNRNNENDNIENYIYCKLSDENEVFGYMVCANANIYTNDDLNILSIFAKQVYLAVKLFEYNIVEVSHRVLANELDILNKQQKLLMDRKRIEESNGKSLNFYHRPSKVVGGDFYYSVKINEDKIAFIVADVMGHGITSNYVVALMKGAFKVLAKVCETSGEIITKLNKILFDEFDKMEMFATGLVCVLDTKKSKLEISNAGHYQPIILDKNKMIVKDINLKKGIPIGILENSNYQTGILDLNYIKSLWMYTDGIVEIKNKNKEEFGIDRIQEVMKKNYYKKYSFLVQELEDTFYEFSKKTNHEDDILLVMLNNTHKP